MKTKSKIKHNNEVDLVGVIVYNAIKKATKATGCRGYAVYLMFQIIGSLIIQAEGNKTHKGYVKEQIENNK